mmetsp:Transcript_16087/g.24476  ORF Transcript_16087/g.24476 Transcript_16087/m.24476 type:complete len:213 (-) Transcript_16087:367-1005(-)
MSPIPTRDFLLSVLYSISGSGNAKFALTSRDAWPLDPSSGNIFLRVNPSTTLIGERRSVRNPKRAYAFPVAMSTAARSLNRVTRSSTAPTLSSQVLLICNSLPFKVSLPPINESSQLDLNCHTPSCVLKSAPSVNTVLSGRNRFRSFRVVCGSVLTLRPGNLSRFPLNHPRSDDATPVESAYWVSAAAAAPPEGTPPGGRLRPRRGLPPAAW